MTDTVAPDVLTDMVDYYQARAAEYDEWWYRQGRYDHGAEQNGRWFAEMRDGLSMPSMRCTSPAMCSNSPPARASGQSGW